jgi:hypothetical protein
MGVGCYYLQARDKKRSLLGQEPAGQFCAKNYIGNRSSGAIRPAVKN